MALEGEGGSLIGGTGTLTVTTAPAQEPVSVNEMMEHLRVDGGEEHDLIGDLIQAAREYVENTTRRALVTQTLTYALDNFPSGTIIELPMPPLASVTSITYTDTAGSSQTMSSSNYSVDIAADPGRVLLETDSTWPSDVKDIESVVSILYVAGYGLAASVPESLRAAIKLLAANWFENREATLSGTIIGKVPLAVESLIWSNRLYTVR